jgi:surface-anchored protein
MAKAIRPRLKLHDLITHLESNMTMNLKFMHLLFTVAFIVGGFTISSRAFADLVEYSAGHSDIGLAFEGNELHLHYHFGVGAVIDGTTLAADAEYAPDEAYVRVSDATKVTVPFDVGFLGANAGDTVWVLPQSNTPGLPFVGLAAEELSSPFNSASYQLIGFSGPGDFALWQTSGLGSPIVSFQTNDGLSTLDKYNLAIGGHDHANWGFTKEGIYDLTILASVTDGTNTYTDTGTFKFAVGNVAAVPEPSSMCLMALAAGSAAWYKRRRGRIANS